MQHHSGLVLEKRADEQAMSRAAADFLLSEISRKPDLLLCTATGASPTRTYELLAEQSRRDSAKFRQIRVLKLDEWGGLAMDDPGSSETYLRRHLLGPLAISNDRYTSFNSEPADPEAECERIRTWLQSHGPIDVCILGLGTNGHLAMNEPAELLKPFAHVAQLANTTLAHSMLAQSARRPSYGLTLGLSEIFQSRKIVLLVSGAHKSKQLARLISGEVSTQFPASLLWLHSNVICFCDQAAASELGTIQPTS